MKRDGTLVLLGGMMCDERVWGHQRRALEACVGRVMMGDLTRSSTIQGMARDALEQAPERFALAGFSMGGIVAFEMWRQAPERISHLAVLDTNAASEAPERGDRRQIEIENASGGRLKEMMIEEFKPHYLGVKSRSNAALLDLILAMALDLGVEVFKRQSLALRDRVDSRPTLGTITCPTTVICGREDALCPPHFHQTIADGIPRAKLTVLEDCGHMSPLERPRAVSRLLEQLLQRRQR